VPDCGKIKFPRRLKEGLFYGLKNLKLLRSDVLVHTTAISNNNLIQVIFLKREVK